MAGEQPEVQVRGAGQGLTVGPKAKPAAYWCMKLWEKAGRCPIL